ncbi:MAG: zinc ABC transporter substrate-binding protein [Acidobacteria bacterium]|nr:zinc ABC transporter substrate-binding protein [Candidatus Sulfomarinibacter kjeldsenii]
MEPLKRRFVLLAMILTMPTASEATIKVVTTQETYASIASELGGERVVAEAIVPGNADAHFVKPKPSYAFMLRDADLFVSTGLDLELWAPVLVNKSGNRNIADGAVGYVAAAHGTDLLEKPASADRSAGDVHIYGNPHIQTSPINMTIVASNITTGLCKVDPEGCEFYRANLMDFKNRLARRLYGDDLVELFGVETLALLAQNGRLVPFLEEQGIADQIGGWLAEAMPFRGRKLVCYHKNWVYFTTLFGLDVVGYVETKPGIPPTARHVAELIQRIYDEDVEVLLAANYFEKRKPELIAERTGIVPVVVPMSVGGEEGVETFFDLVDLWIERLRDAYGVSGGTDEHVHHGEESHHDVHDHNE